MFSLMSKNSVSKLSSRLTNLSVPYIPSRKLGSMQGLKYCNYKAVGPVKLATSGSGRLVGKYVLGGCLIGGYLISESYPDYANCDTLTNHTIDAHQKQHRILYFIKHSNKYLAKIPIEYRTYNVCCEFVKYHPFNLSCVPDHLKDKNICHMAISHDYNAFKYVPNEMKTKEMCEEVVKKNSRMMIFVPRKLEQKKCIVYSLRIIAILR